MNTSKANVARVRSGFWMLLTLTTTSWFTLVLHSFKAMPGIKKSSYDNQSLSCGSPRSTLPNGPVMVIEFHIRLRTWSYVCQIICFQYIAYNHWPIAYLVIECNCSSHWHIWVALNVPTLVTNSCCKKSSKCLLGKSESNKLCCFVLLVTVTLN